MIYEGTCLTASAHIVSAVIGSGVLSLAWAVAQLGWIGGSVSLLLFSLITLLTSSLTADCYRYPDPVHGIRNPTYKAMVKNILGNYIIQFLMFLIQLYICINFFPGITIVKNSIFFS